MDPQILILIKESEPYHYPKIKWEEDHIVDRGFWNEKAVFWWEGAD